MDGSILESHYEEHRRRWECGCPNNRYVYRILSNGVKHWGTQCCRCGKWKAIRLDAIPFKQRKDLPEYDPEIPRSFQDRKHRDFQDNVKAVRVDEWNKKQRERETYYTAPKWKRLTQFRLRLNEKLFNGLCEVCFEQKACRCHHVTYERLFREWIFDLAAVCEGCHRFEHEKSPFWSGHNSEGQ